MSSKPGMELQRPDSYQGGAGPDFNEHVLHKVQISLLGPNAGRGRRHQFSQFLDFALGLKEKLACVCEPEEPFLFAAQNRRVSAGGGASA